MSKKNKKFVIRSLRYRKYRKKKWRDTKKTELRKLINLNPKILVSSSTALMKEKSNLNN